MTSQVMLRRKRDHARYRRGRTRPSPSAVVRHHAAVGYARVARACRNCALDAAGGGGSCPTSADFGDDVALDTLGNLARVVKGLDLPTLEALALVGRLRRPPGRPPSSARGACRRRGRLRRWPSRGKDTTTGHWELMGILTPQAMPTYPARLPGLGDRPVHERDWARCDSGTFRRAGRRSSRSSGRKNSEPVSGSSARARTRSSRSPRTKETIPARGAAARGQPCGAQAADRATTRSGA